MVAKASRWHMYYVSGEHLFRNNGYGKILKNIINPIPLAKGKNSTSSIKEIMKRVKDGNNIMMFPEGKRSFHGETIPATLACAKLVKRLKCTLITYKIEGGFFTYPRWAKTHRKGKVWGHVVNIYHSDKLNEMSDKEVTDVINRDIYDNAYVTQREKMYKYKGKNLALGLDNFLFTCPNCLSDSIYSFDNVAIFGYGI